MKKTNKTAIVVGATGATGEHLVQLLLSNSAYSKVVTLVRRSAMFEHERLEEHIVDFDQPDQWSHLVKGDELFSAMGTTLKLAGGRQQQYKVDIVYQYEVARAAKHNKVDQLILISSPNANSRSRNFYLRIKGELEDKVKALNFARCVLIKPSIIVSERPEGRPAERMGATVLNSLVGFMPMLKPYRPISARDLALASINIANRESQSNEKQGEENQTIELVLGDIFKLIKSET